MAKPPRRSPRRPSRAEQICRRSWSRHLIGSATKRQSRKRSSEKTERRDSPFDDMPKHPIERVRSPLSPPYPFDTQVAQEPLPGQRNGLHAQPRLQSVAALSTTTTSLEINHSSRHVVNHGLFAVIFAGDVSLRRLHLAGTVSRTGARAWPDSTFGSRCKAIGSSRIFLRVFTDKASPSS